MPLEKIFTVVYWDQRGSGESFARKINRSTMTVEHFIADLDELVQAVRERVGGKQVMIFGHSWGSALGVLYAARFAEVAAYIGWGRSVTPQRASRRRTRSRSPKRTSQQPQGTGQTARD